MTRASELDAAVQTYDKLFIAGEWVEPASGKTFESLNPATGKTWAVVGEGFEEDIDRAVKAAHQAFESGPWPAMTPSRRGALLRKLGDLTLKNADRLARLESLDNGKAIRETAGVEMPATAQWYYYFAGLADKIEGTTIPVGGDFHVYTVREPVGVCGCIVPWNSPYLMAAFKIAPALAAGNTVVLKPAEHTSVTALELGRLVEEAGFPPGVVNVVPGFGETAGEALVRHPDVDKIAFTGETSTGQVIARNAADTLKHVSFELGGKSPNIVFDDTDLDDAVTAAMGGVFVASGQTCVAGSRLFLHEKIHDAFLEKLVSRASKIRVGDPLKKETLMGSQTCEQQWNKVRELVQSGVAEGAEVLTGGKPPEDPALSSGFFFTPTVFSRVSHDMRIACEEIFGPVVSTFRFSDEDELVERVNAVKYGLAGGVWTRDLKRALRVSRRIKAGTIWINCYRKVHWAVPFGGYKMSGYGRENGQEVIDLYTQTKTVWMDLTESQANPYAT